MYVIYTGPPTTTDLLSELIPWHNYVANTFFQDSVLVKFAKPGTPLMNKMFEFERYNTLLTASDVYTVIA